MLDYDRNLLSSINKQLKKLNSNNKPKSQINTNPVLCLLYFLGISFVFAKFLGLI